MIMKYKSSPSSSSSKSHNYSREAIRKTGQTVSTTTGRINISKKGWIIRIFTLVFLASLILIYNLYFGLKNPESQPIMIYTGFVISLSILILAFGWVCYRNPAISPAAVLASSVIMRISEKDNRNDCSTTCTSGINSNHNKRRNANDDKNRQLNYHSSTDLITNDLVSVIIPIYNQKDMIKNVIDSILNSTYTNIEIIAVNDGSNDGTKKLLDNLKNNNKNIKNKCKYSRLKLIHKNNEGKRKAVARGFFESKGNYLVLIDSDSIVDKNAIEQIIKTFSANAGIGAVAGHAKILNADRNFLTKCQDAWYDYEFNIYKACESYFGSVTCCCGCLAAYRRETIEKFVPLWTNSDDGTNGGANGDNNIYDIEDNNSINSSSSVSGISSTIISKSKSQSMDSQSRSPLPFASLSKKLLNSLASYDDSEDRALTTYSLLKCKSVYVSNAVVYTDVPEKLNSFIKQQQRWKKGYLRANLFASTFFWLRNNPIMSLIFYAGFMMTLVSPIITIVALLYSIFTLHNILFPLFLVGGYLLVGFFEGLDYRIEGSYCKILDVQAYNESCIVFYGFMANVFCHS